MRIILVVILLISVFCQSDTGVIMSATHAKTNVMQNKTPHLIQFEPRGSQEYSFKKSSWQELKRNLQYVWYEVKVAVCQQKATSIANVISHMFNNIARLYSACIIGEEWLPMIHLNTSDLRRSVHYSVSPCHHFHLNTHVQLNASFLWHISVHIHFMVELHVHHAYIHYSDECKVTSFMVSEPHYGSIQQFCGHSWDKLIYTKSHTGVLETTGKPYAYVTFDISYQIMTKGFAAQFTGTNFTAPTEVKLNFHYTPNFIYYKYDYCSYYWLFYNPTSFQIMDKSSPVEIDDSDLRMTVFHLHIHKFYCHTSSSLKVWKGLNIHTSITNMNISPFCIASCQPTTSDMMCSLSMHKYMTLILHHYILESQLELVMNVSAEIRRHMSTTILNTETERHYHAIGTVHPSHTFFTNIYDAESCILNYKLCQDDPAVAVSLLVTHIDYIGEKMNLKSSDVHSLPRLTTFASEGPKGLCAC